MRPLFIPSVAFISVYQYNHQSSSSTGLGGSSKMKMEIVSRKTNLNAKSRRLYSFEEARKIARGHGFDLREEFIEYECAGAYQLPNDADAVWKEVSYIQYHFIFCIHKLYIHLTLSLYQIHLGLERLERLSGYYLII